MLAFFQCVFSITETIAHLDKVDQLSNGCQVKHWEGSNLNCIVLIFGLLRPRVQIQALYFSVGPHSDVPSVSQITYKLKGALVTWKISKFS
jgi:hypothetical protein